MLKPLYDLVKYLESGLLIQSSDAFARFENIPES